VVRTVGQAEGFYTAVVGDRIKCSPRCSYWLGLKYL